MKTLTAKEWALYLGCAFIHCKDDTNYNLEGIQFTFGRLYLTTPDNIEIPADEAKLLLRPLFDITEEEAKEFLKLFGPKSYRFIELQTKASTWFSVKYKNANGNEYYNSFSINQINAKQIPWYLSKGFDLFDWIEQGLAVNALDVKS